MQSAITRQPGGYQATWGAAVFDRVFKFRFACVLLVVALLAAACGDDGDDGDTGSPTTTGDSGDVTTTAAPMEPTVGGSLTYNIGADARTLDPKGVNFFSGAGGGMERMFMVFGALAVEDFESKSVMPHMAESVDTTDGGTTWVVKLRPGLTFSDGTPFDADAVVANWERYTDTSQPSAALLLMLAMESYTATDPTTVTVVLKAVNTQWPRTLAASSLSFVGSPTAIEQLGPDFGLKPVGAGPFLLTEWVQGSHTSFVRNPDYWDAPRPYVDEITVRMVTDEQQRVDSFNAGEADVFWSGVLDTAMQGEDGGGTVFTVPGLANQGFYYNLAIPPLNDKRVREAFAMAYDLEQIGQTAYGTPAPKGMFEESSPYYDPAITYPERDLVAAQELIDAYVAENGPIDITFTVITGNATVTATAQIVKSNLEELDGVSVTINQMETAAMVTDQRAGKLEFAQTALLGAAADPVFYNTWYTGSPFNISKYSNPEVDAALDASRATLDEDEQLAAMNEVQRLLVEDLAYQVFRTTEYYIVSQPEVHDVLVYGDSIFRPDLIWLES
jgi:peptide/nickel transport system substrate-binding protein